MNDFLSDIYWRWGPDGCKACGADVAYSLTRAGEGHPWVGSVTCSGCEDFRAFEAVEPAWSPPQGAQPWRSHCCSPSRHRRVVPAPLAGAGRCRRGPQRGPDER